MKTRFASFLMAVALAACCAENAAPPAPARKKEEALLRQLLAPRLPGLPRTEKPVFKLTEINSIAMVGCDDPKNERWFDLADNRYSDRFRSFFSYTNRGPNAPEVRLQVKPAGETLSGRIEARRLKPNFCYQIKVLGDFSDRTSFERIGYTGRWRLPGYITNYDDADYVACSNKAAVEAYVLFDFMITDDSGHSVRDFGLDSSLHVLVRLRPRHGCVASVKAAIAPTNAAVYATPRHAAATEAVWVEYEYRRYTSTNLVVRLPRGTYRARLALTEECFHSRAPGGGRWATVMSAPIEFEIR